MRYQLKIENPCNEDWNKMSPKEQGRYCEACKTVVMDFSKLSEEEIINWLKTRKGETCGRVRMSEQQLHHIYYYADKKSNPFSKVAFKYSVAGLLIFGTVKGYSQPSKPNITQAVSVKDNSGKFINGADHKNIAANQHKIMIRVTDNFTGKNLNNAYVSIAGESKIYRPEKGSSFILITVADSLKEIRLYVYCSGYDTDIRTVSLQDNKEQNLNVSLYKDDGLKMGKMIYVPEPDTTKSKNSK